MTLTPSHIIEYLYCPRFTYFEYVLGIPQYEEKHYKVMRGRELHDEKLEQNKDYLRKRLGVEQKWLDQYLTTDGLRGKIDEVLRLNDGSYAPLDYKFAEWKGTLYNTYKTQVYCYALLIQANFKGAIVERGYIVYTRSNHRVERVAVSNSDIEDVKYYISQIQNIIEKNYFPKATKYKERCVNCTYRNICIK